MSTSPSASDLARVLLERQRSLRVQRAQRADELRTRAVRALRAALAHRTIAGAWLIGSLAWGEHGAESDVDIVVEGLAPDGLPGLWISLMEQLDSKVDLIRLEDLPSAFARRVREEGIPIR